MSYPETRQNGKRRSVHRFRAERALGRPLRFHEHVHHVDCTKNPRSELVICQDAEYHHLLHLRTRALDACGNPNWRRCRYCGQHDAPENLVSYSGRGMHLACSAAEARQRRAKRFTARKRYSARAG